MQITQLLVISTSGEFVCPQLPPPSLLFFFLSWKHLFPDFGNSRYHMTSPNTKSRYSQSPQHGKGSWVLQQVQTHLEEPQLRVCEDTELKVQPRKTHPYRPQWGALENSLKCWKNNSSQILVSAVPRPSVPSFFWERAWIYVLQIWLRNAWLKHWELSH